MSALICEWEQVPEQVPFDLGPPVPGRWLVPRRGTTPADQVKADLAVRTTSRARIDAMRAVMVTERAEHD